MRQKSFVINLLKLLMLSVVIFNLTGCGFAKETKISATNVSGNKMIVNQTPGNLVNSTPETAKTNDTKILNVNLIQNGNAETGNGNGWTNSENLKTIVYGDFGGGPYRDTPGPANRGDKYFYTNVGSTNPSVIFTQKIETSEVGEAIDKGKINYNLSGWFGGINGSYSSARLKVLFLDKDGKELGKDETAEVKESDRENEFVLIERNKGGNLPNGTRKIEVTLECYIRAGHDGEEVSTNAFADNLSLVLTQKEGN